MKLNKVVSGLEFMNAFARAGVICTANVAFLRVRGDMDKFSVFMQYANEPGHARNGDMLLEFNAKDDRTIYHRIMYTIAHTLAIPAMCQKYTIECSADNNPVLINTEGFGYAVKEHASEGLVMHVTADPQAMTTLEKMLQCAEKHVIDATNVPAHTLEAGRTEVLKEAQAIQELPMYAIVEHEKYGQGIIIPTDCKGNGSKIMARFFRPGVAPKYIMFDGLKASELQVVAKPDIFIDKESGTAYIADSVVNHKEGHMVKIEAVDGKHGHLIRLSDLMKDYYVLTDHVTEDAMCDCDEDFEGVEGDAPMSCVGYSPLLKDVTGVEQALEYVDRLGMLAEGSYAHELDILKRLNRALNYIERNASID